MNRPSPKSVLLATLSLIGFLGSLWLAQLESNSPTRRPASADPTFQPRLSRPVPTPTTRTSAATQMPNQPASGQTGMDLIDSIQTLPDSRGHFYKVEIFKTSGRFPLLRVKTTYRSHGLGDPSLVLVEKMPADQVIAQLSQGVTLESLEGYLKPLGATVAKQLRTSGLVIISFDGTSASAMDKLLSDFQNRPDLFRVSTPNGIVSLKN